MSKRTRTKKDNKGQLATLDKILEVHYYNFVPNLSMEEISSTTQENVKDELAVIESMYPSELENLTEPQDTKLTLKFKVGVCDASRALLKENPTVTLKVTTSDGYPAKPADFQIEWCERLEKKEIEELTNGLSKLCQKYAHLKKIMISDMVEFVRNFLTDHAKLIETEETLNETDDGLTRQNKFKEAKERALKVLKEEARQRKESYKGGSLDGLGQSNVIGSLITANKWILRSQSKTANEIDSPRPIMCHTSGQQKSLYMISSFHKRRNMPCSLYLSQMEQMDEFCLSYQYTVGLKTKDSYWTDSFLQKIRAIEAEIKSLFKLTHENIVPYLGFNFDTTDTGATITIVQDFISPSLQLSYFVDHNVPLSEKFLRHVCSDVLRGLNFLHSHDVVHRNLRDSCLIIDARSHAIRISDFGIDSKCVEAVMEFIGQDVTFQYPKSPGKSAKKADIYRLGLVLISLSQGSRVVQTTPPTPENISSNFSNFLSKCLAISESNRWPVEKLQLHKFLTSDPEDESSEIVNQSIEDGEMDEDAPPVWSTKKNGVSRYQEEYECLEEIGKGGFGQVFKVRHKMVGKIYAIKRIPMERPSQSKWKKMLAEVQLLSSLNHENIVRYYTAWKEVVDTNIIEKDETSTLESSVSVINIAASELDDSDAVIQPDDWMAAIPRFQQIDDDDSEVVFYDSEASTKKSEESIQPSRSLNTPINGQCSVLYIQMEFCDKRTLRQAIDTGLYLDSNRYWRLFRELINGIDYIHGRGLIHRDLKPGNIFLDSDDHVKIGDFGLAKLDSKVQANNVDEPTDDPESTTMTSQVGTTFYIAPEINNLSSRTYSKKVDMYSLGIIFFEMLHYFHTHSERAAVLTNLRKSTPVLPESVDDFLDENQKKIVLELLTHDPSKRPSAVDLLKSSLLPPPTAEHKKFMDTLCSTIKNVQSTDYKELLHLIFRRNCREELEATFDLASTKSKTNLIWQNDYVRSLVTSVFTKHGAVYLPTNFFTPKNATYKNKDGVPQFMSQGGELVCAQYELHYPFARWLANKDCKRLKRYNIDRVQREFKALGFHPLEFYQCAFDIVDRKSESHEAIVKVLLVAQEVFQTVIGLQDHEVEIVICHQKLTRMILEHCCVQPSEHDKILFLLKHHQNLEERREHLKDYLKVNRVGYNMLCGFFDMQASVCEVFTALCQKGLVKSKNYNLASIQHELNGILEAANIMGVKFRISLDPLLVLDDTFFSGISFQFVRQCVYIKPQNLILARGGAYEDIVAQHKETLRHTCQKISDIGICVVGVSIPLFHLVAHMPENKKETAIIESYNSALCAKKPCIFLFAVEERQLVERIKIAEELEERGLTVDHGFFAARSEVEDLAEEMWYLSYIVVLGPNEETVLVKTVRSDSSKGKSSIRRKVSRDQVVAYLAQQMKLSTVSEKPLKKDFSKASNQENNVQIEFVTKKSFKNKDDKLSRTIMEEASSYVFHRYPGLNYGTEVLAVDLNRREMLMFGMLDIDSTRKSYTESVTELKTKFSDSKEYVDKICKIIEKKVFNRTKKSEKFSLILLYSIPSEMLKRI